jgi:hypothetical protein
MAYRDRTIREVLRRHKPDDCKFLAGAFAQHSQLPEELLFIVFDYQNFYHIGECAIVLVCELDPLPSLALHHINITLARLSEAYFTFERFVEVFRMYDEASQARVFATVPAEEIIRLFHIRKKRIIYAIQDTAADIQDTAADIQDTADRGLRLLRRFNAAVPTD